MCLSSVCTWLMLQHPIIDVTLAEIVNTNAPAVRTVVTCLSFLIPN